MNGDLNWLYYRHVRLSVAVDSKFLQASPFTPGDKFKNR